MLVKYIGEVILERRKALKIPQSTLADMAGISINTLYKIERGQSNPTLDILDKIFDVLGLECIVSIRKIK